MKNNYHKKHFVDLGTQKEIAKLYNKKNKKVKPCYKKKLKNKIFKLKQKAKRKYLDQRYRRIRQEQYKRGK